MGYIEVNLKDEVKHLFNELNIPFTVENIKIIEKYNLNLCLSFKKLIIELIEEEIIEEEIG